MSDLPKLLAVAFLLALLMTALDRRSAGLTNNLCHSQLSLSTDGRCK